MTKKALLVGINYPGTPNELRGCVNDVITMSQVLAEQYGFTDPNNRRMLTDGAATMQNILERLDWLVDGAQPGDVLVFHYSGHGAQTINRDYSESAVEPDGLDELICPVDFDWRGNMITDDQLNSIFSRVPEGVNLTVILDCCHSGGGIDSLTQYQPFGRSVPNPFSPDSPNRNRSLPMPPDIANRMLGANIQSVNRVLTQVIDQTRKETSAVLISGCQSNQTSADTFIGNQYVGALTFFLTHILKQSNYRIAYRDLIDRVSEELAKFNYTQRPELNGSSKLFNREFLSPLN